MITGTVVKRGLTQMFLEHAKTLKKKLNKVHKFYLLAV